MKEDITFQEQQEYMAYHSWKDVINNLQIGIRDLDHVPNEFKNSNKVLICGAMIAFDKGLSNFLNTWYFYQNDLILLSEVTAQYRRYTKERIKMPFICTPHLLAKEMVIRNMPIPIESEIEKTIKSKKYLKNAVFNMSSLNTQNKVKKAYARFDLLIIDEWLLRPLPESEAYDLLELIDACSRKGALILCTQYDVDDWYYRIDCDRAEDEGSAVAEGILDRIINNKYNIEVKGRISMRKRHAFSDEGSGVNDNG